MISSDPPRAINPEGEKSAIEKRYSFYDQIFYDTDELRAWIKSTRVASKPHLTKTCIVTDQDWPSPFVLKNQIDAFCFGSFKIAKGDPEIFKTMKASTAAGDVIFKKLRQKILNPYLGYEQLDRITSGLLNFPLLKSFELQGGGPKKLITSSGTLFHIDLVITWLERRTEILTFERSEDVAIKKTKENHEPEFRKGHEKPKKIIKNVMILNKKKGEK